MSNKFPFAFQENVAHPTQKLFFSPSLSLSFSLYLSLSRHSYVRGVKAGYGDFLL
jgi:hypothetical protein